MSSGYRIDSSGDGDFQHRGFRSFRIPRSSVRATVGEQAPVTPMRGQADREEEKNCWEDGDEEDDYSSVSVIREH